ncbi:CheW-like protein [Candidatus Vecturithrix granuli]|uniref:CheW-like protein n=1 Tax=Vecturithrix granuli TaxID=1499967 RepID=A0A081C646_VECG1|nr:CheW-like protein [Candidatus Vecturithrix granuli]
MAEQCQMHENLSEILQTVKQQDQQEQIIEIEEKFIQLVIILLAEHYYAFYGSAIKEIVTVPEIAYVPGMPDYILGVIYIRGDIESVLDLRRILKLPQNVMTKRSRIIIGEAAELRSGLLVDSVEDVLEIPEDQISASSAILDEDRAGYIRGESSYKGKELIILDIEKIFEKLFGH